MLKISERLRAQRHMMSRATPRNVSSIAGMVTTYVKNRIVYDMMHIADDNLLPGKPVRRENDSKDMGDKDVDKCFHNTALVYDFYKEVFKRNSLDDNGMTMHSSVNFDDDLDNAFWNGRQMTYGNGSDIFMKAGTLTDLVVVAHELTHGVTQHEANLIYSSESGGLNEHMSDAFAIMCDQWVNKHTADDSHWLIGKDMMVKGQALRSMEKPGTARPSDHQVSSYNDYTEGMGPHTSSGIANKAFCLACKKVGGNTWERLGKVWYITLKDKLREASTFQDAANHTFRVAGDLFGDSSKEQEAVSYGWSEVGIEAENPNVSDLLVDRNTLLKKIDARL